MTGLGLEKNLKLFSYTKDLMFKMESKGLHYKCFKITIYKCNGNGLYHKSTILANLALARSKNYDIKVSLQIEAYFLQFYIHKSRLWGCYNVYNIGHRAALRYALVVHANIRLRWKWLTMLNTLTYYVVKLTTQHMTLDKEENKLFNVILWI
jgi:hypothetical protein